MMIGAVVAPGFADFTVSHFYRSDTIWLGGRGTATNDDDDDAGAAQRMLPRADGDDDVPLPLDDPTDNCASCSQYWLL